MSLIEKKHLNYLSTVEQFFLSLKDCGLALSANDYHLIGEWEERGVPINVLCCAIQKGFEDLQHRNRRPFQNVALTHIRQSIEQEINRVKNR